MPPFALGGLAARPRGVVLLEAPRGTLPVLLGSRPGFGLRLCGLYVASGAQARLHLVCLTHMCIYIYIYTYIYTQGKEKLLLQETQ